MMNATSISFKTGRAALTAAARTVLCGGLMALPLCGLVLFFEMTQPAKVMNAGLPAAWVSSSDRIEMSDAGISTPLARGHASVARFDGVSAQQRTDYITPAAQIVTANDARSVLSQAPFGSLKPGLQVDFISRDKHRISLLIVSREPIIDRAIPDNVRLMNITEASTANSVTFAWGNWIYRAEIEDKGVQPDVVVQKVL